MAARRWPTLIWRGRWLGARGFDLREYLSNVREHLAASGWKAIDEDLLLEDCGGDLWHRAYREVDVERLARAIKASPDVVISAGELVVCAAKVLSDSIGILGPASLPYTQVLVVAARAFHESKKRLSKKAHSELIAWVAEVCLDERFGGAPRARRASRMAELFARRLALPSAELAGAKRDDRNTTVKECWKFSLAWARSVGTGLVLAAQRPRRADGKPMKNPSAYVARGSDDVGMLFAAGGEGVPVALGKGNQENARCGVAIAKGEPADLRGEASPSAPQGTSANRLLEVYSR